MNKRMFFSIIIVLMLIFSTGLFSCSMIEGLFEETPIDAEVTISDIQYEDFSMASTIITYNVTVKNNTSVKLKINSYDYKISFKNNYEYLGSSSDAISINKNDSAVFSIVQEINFYDMAREITDFSQNESLEAVLSGTLKLENSTESKELTFESTQDMIIPQLPEITTGGVEVKKLDFTYVVLGFNIIVENPNSFDMTFTPSYTINFSDSSVLKVNNDSDFIVEADTKKTQEIEVEIDLLTVSARILSSKDINISFNGKLEYLTFNGDTETSVNITDKFTVPLLPEVTLKNIGIETTTIPPSAKLSLILEVNNKNDFKIDIVGWNASVSLNKVNLISSYSIDPVTIQSNTKKRVTVPITIDPTVIASSGISGTFLATIKLQLKSLLDEEDIELEYNLEF